MNLRTDTLGSGIQAYRQSILGSASPAKADGSSSNGPAVKTSAATASPKIASTIASVDKGKTDRVRQELDGLQTGIATDLRSALSMAGLKLEGTVNFKVNAKGVLDITGSPADKVQINQVLSADRGVPSLSTRIRSLDQKVAAHDTANTRSAAMASAARHTAPGQSANLMRLYQSLVSQNSGSSAVFSVSGKASQLSFSGAVNAKA